MHSKAVSAPVYVELLNPEIIGDDDVNSALLAAMRLWEEETQEARNQLAWRSEWQRRAKAFVTSSWHNLMLS